MDKIILATTLAALMAANKLPALDQDNHSETRADKSGAGREPIFPHRADPHATSREIMADQA